jgi:RND family efflux transporter MFP subunit
LKQRIHIKSKGIAIHRAGGILALAFLVATILPPLRAWAADRAIAQGFTEPYRTIRVASVESGVLKRLLVQEGDKVEEGRPLGELDTSVHKAALEAAKASRDARADLDLARAEHLLRQNRMDLLLQLHADTFASDEEARRARTELEIAAAQVRSAEEKQLLRKLEYDRLAAQLEARTIRAPQDGTITTIQKQTGEYLGPNDPVLLTMVQLQPLAAVFLVPRDQVTRLNEGQAVAVVFPSAGSAVNGTIEYLAPVVDAGSGTVTVRVRLDNPDRALRAGEPCELWRDAPPSTGETKPQPLRLDTSATQIGPQIRAPANPLRPSSVGRTNPVLGKKTSIP